MANYASLRGPVGMNRVFVQAPGRGHSTPARFSPALKAGRTFATNGPLLEFSLDGQRDRAERSQLGAGSHSLTARVELRSIVPVEQLEIVGNGQVVATCRSPATGPGDGTVTIR